MLLKNILFKIETEEEIPDFLITRKNLLSIILSEPNPLKQKELADANLQLLGKGSGRFVYDLGEGKALKLAPSTPEQNIREYKHWKCVEGTLAQNIFVKVYAHADDYSWLIVENVVGFKIGEENLALELIFSSMLQPVNNKLITKEMLAKYFDSNLNKFWAHLVSNKELPFYSKWYNILKQTIKSCNINVCNFIADNLGYRPSTGEFVIVDFGY